LIIPCSTHQVVISVIFHRIHNNWRPLWGKDQRIIKYHGFELDIEKFTGDNDFGLWKIKMEAVLIQQKCEKALKGDGALPVTMSRAEKTEKVDKARSAIVLCLGDKVLREVAKEPTATSMLEKLESLYMTKSLAHQ